MKIRLANLNDTGIEVNFGDVRLNASPEPSTVILGAIGMIGVMLKRHRMSAKIQTPPQK